jgi:hypothetical protein
MLGHDVGREAGVGPGMRGRIAVVELRDDDELLRGAFRCRGTDRPREDVHPIRAERKRVRGSSHW